MGGCEWSISTDCTDDGAVEITDHDGIGMVMVCRPCAKLHGVVMQEQGVVSIEKAEPAPRPWRLRPDHRVPEEYDGIELLDANGEDLGLRMEEESPEILANAQHAIDCVNRMENLKGAIEAVLEAGFCTNECPRDCRHEVAIKNLAKEAGL